jgi:hypothetical protein
MGANTHIGNAPNFMVRLICEERGIKMPSFIGYMLWSSAFSCRSSRFSPGSGSREPRPRAASPSVWK